eukprot:3460710-Rhodomonas_salina.2
MYLPSAVCTPPGIAAYTMSVPDMAFRGYRTSRSRQIARTLRQYPAWPRQVVLRNTARNKRQETALQLQIRQKKPQSWYESKGGLNKGGGKQLISEGKSTWGLLGLAAAVHGCELQEQHLFGLKRRARRVRREESRAKRHM